MFWARLCRMCTGFAAIMLVAVFGFAVGLIFNQQDVPVLTPIIDFVVDRDDDRPVRPAPFANSNMFEAAFDGAKPAPLTDKQQPVSLLVNHHLLAPNLVAQALQTVASEKRRTVVLISPNHFSLGSGALITSISDWQTPYGRLRSDDKLIKELAAAGTLTIDEQPFEREHGIYNIVPFIKKVMPDARIVPVIVNNRTSATTVYAAAAEMLAQLPSDALVIGSFDFSHAVTEQMADFHDQTSLAVLDTMDIAGTSVLNIDSRPGLALLMQLSSLRGANQFVVFSHENAVDYTHDAEMMDVTSYVTGAFIEGSSDTDGQATILAFGDLMMNRMVRKSLEKYGNRYPFETILRSLNGTDLTVANLEGTITDHEPVRLEPDSIKFTFDPSVAPALRAVGFDILSLANNHSRDFAREGLNQTKTNLDAAGIRYFGDYSNFEGISYTQTIRGVKMTLVGFHEFSYTGRQETLDEIKRASETSDVVIVYPHWGVEYQPTPSTNQVYLAHQFIDAGADIVLGSHPHVVQPVEIYKDKLIVYSMGNFVFDQQFSQGVKNGVAVGLTVNKKGLENKGVEVNLFPYSISPTFQVEWYQPNKATDFFVDYAKRANVTDAVASDMSDGHFIIAPN